MANERVVGDAWAVILEPLRELRGSWPTRGWSWDARHSCVASSFSVEVEAEARAAANRGLPLEWTPATIDRAPTALRDVADRTGGLREGQALLGTLAIGRAFAYGLWWPWGDGMSISARVGLAGPGVTADVLQRLRDLFSVEL